MKNKEMINKLRDNAELAIAVYGYFHLANPKYDFNKDSTDKERLEYFREKIAKNQTAIPTPEDILNMEHKYFKDNNGKPKDSWYHKHFLGGDFSPTQVKNFFDKYDLLDFYPKFDTKNNKQKEGFHACLFQDRESKEYTLAIRGSFDSKDYVEADFWHLLINSTIPFDYYNDMLNFYEQCIEKYPNLKQSKSLNIVGHSLGGALAQMLTLSLCDNTNEANINEVYTFNKSLESRSVA